MQFNPNTYTNLLQRKAVNTMTDGVWGVMTFNFFNNNKIIKETKKLKEILVFSGKYGPNKKYIFNGDQIYKKVTIFWNPIQVEIFPHH